MPNGMETKLREWRRYQTKYPNLRSISNPYNAKGDLTLEAKVAWDNKTEAVPAAPAPTPAPVPTAQTTPIPVSPDQDPDQRSWLGMGLPSPVWKAWDFFVPTREAREGRAPLPFEKYLLGRDTPWEPRLSTQFYAQALPKWAGVEAASGVASLLEQPWAGGSPPTPEQVAERAQLDAQLQKESGEGTFRDYLERRIQKGELKAKDLNPVVRFGAEILPTLLADIAVTRGRGTVGLVSKLRPPVKVGGVELPGAVVRQPGIPAALRRTAATALEPVAATEELATKALGPTLRAITGTGPPAALRALEAGMAREAPGVVPSAARAAGVAPEIPIDTGSQVMADFPTSFDETVKIAIHPDNWRKIANLPILRTFQGKFNPSAVANDPIAQAAVARSRLRDDANTLVVRTMARLNELGEQSQIFGNLDEKGLIADGPLKSLSVNDIRSNPKKFKGLIIEAEKGSKQPINEWISIANDVENAKLNYLKRNGIKVPELTFEEGGQYAGRRIFAKVNDLGEIDRIGSIGVGPKRVGAKLGQEKARYFKTEAEGIEAGFRYLSADEALNINVRGAYNRVIDKRYADWLLDGNIDYRTLAAPEWTKVARIEANNRIRRAEAAKDALLRARRGEVLHPGTVAAIERIFPQIKGKVREPTRLRIEDVLRAAKELKEPERVFEVPHPGQFNKAILEVKKAEELLALDPKNQVLQSDLKEKNSYLRFLRYRWKVFKVTGKPLTIPHNVIKALRKEANEDLDELLTAVRGTLVRRPGLSPRYEGGLIADIRKESAKKLQAAQEAADKAKVPTFDEGVVTSPAFAGKAFPQETQKRLMSTLEPKFHNAISKINKVNAVSRYFMLGADISPMQIQLLWLMGRDPKSFAIAGKGFVEAMLDTKFHARYMNKPDTQEVLRKYPGLNLVGGGRSETTEALGPGGILGPGIKFMPKGEAAWKTAALMPPRVFGKVVGPTARPFARGFEGALDVAGVEFLKSIDHLGTTAVRREAIAQHVNKLRGVTSSARLGVSVATAQEETLALLAPRYMRGIAALLFDLFNGGLSGQLARESMARGAAALSALSVAISLAKGESIEEATSHLTPVKKVGNEWRTNPEFLTWKIAGQNVGPGSKVRSVISLFARTSTNPEDLKSINWENLEYMRNPIIRFARGQTSPVISGGFDLLSGKDFLGDPTRDGLLQMSETVAERFMYIWAQSMFLEKGLFEGDVRGALVRGATEFAGWRAYPTPPGEQRREIGAKLAQEAQEPSRVPEPPDERGALEKAWNIAWPSPGAREARERPAPQGTYGDIAVAKGYKIPTSGLFAVDPAVLRDSPEEYWQYDRATRNLIEKNPEYEELKRKAIESTKRWNPALGEYKEKELERTNTLREQLEGIAKESRDKDSRRPMAWYKTRVKLILHVYYHDREKAREEAKKKGILGKDRDPDGPFQQAEDIYYRLLFTDDKDLLTKIFGGGKYALIEDPNTGEFNWDEREERLNYLITTYGENFVRDMKEASLANLPPVEVKRRKDIDFIESTGYWDAEKILAKHYGVEEAHKEYVRLKRKNVPKSEEFLKNQAPAGLRLAVKYTRRTRLQMRKNNSRLDEILLYNGYAKTPALEQ